MTATLASEFSRFCGFTQRLRTILDETKRCFGDINNNGKYNGDQILSAEFLREEELEVNACVERRPSIVVLGQNVYSKSRILREIFSKDILPVMDESDCDKIFRIVVLKHGEGSSVSLDLPDEYNLIDTLESNHGSWKAIPKGDFQLQEDEKSEPINGLSVMEVTLQDPLLRSGAQVVVSPCNHSSNIEEVMNKLLDGVNPVIIYGFTADSLSAKDVKELDELRGVINLQPVLFVRVPPHGVNSIDTDPPDGAPGTIISPFPIEVDQIETEIIETNHVPVRTANAPLSVFHQLCELNYISEEPNDSHVKKNLTANYFNVESKFIDNFSDFSKGIHVFVKKVLRSFLVNAATVLNTSHARCLNMFILSAFDMAREMMVTPKRLEFVKEKETELYKSLLEIALSKHDEIKSLIVGTIDSVRTNLTDLAAEYDFIGVDIDENGQILTHKGLKICTAQIQELILGRLNQAVASKLIGSVNILRDSYTGTLTRCLESLENVNKEHTDGGTTTEALKQILNAAYQVEITVRSSSSLIRVLLERMKQMMQAMPWKAPPKIDDEWKKKVASDMLESLSEARLAKSISSQIKERLAKSHESFGIALKQLETKHGGRLDRIEEERLKLRKVHAPRVAKLALESTSLKDVILHGTPQMGREIGRGQYGVVYSCDKWSKYSPCAIKSVVPPDDKHWNDLALEFYYTKNVPDHDRIVSLRGSVIDYQYGGGISPAVLLIMERLQRDLYTALKQGMDWPARLLLAVDVVEGIRFLHSQGLVHRDIKLKNVLLDKQNRGKITDLGFCKPEAMMSGSIVGTPIHMAPELFSGRYDNSVDVYAFGILFWYVCAGHVRLPSSFEQCANKDQLWQSVKKGLRPERLPAFTEDCWNLMSICWDGEPLRRPLLGNVQSQLNDIKSKVKPILPTKTKDKHTMTKHISAKHL